MKCPDSWTRISTPSNATTAAAQNSRFMRAASAS
jgi:hypothetical protein